MIVWLSQNPNWDYVTLDISGGRKISKALSAVKIRQEGPLHSEAVPVLTTEPNTGECGNGSMCEQKREGRVMTKLPAGNTRFEIMEPFEGHVSLSDAILFILLPCA